MADNIAPDEVKRRLILFLRIPNETWTDVLKMFSRRILVQNIAPACYRLKDICDKNVKNVHEINNVEQFINKLTVKANDPEAKLQLEHLAQNHCKLAGQFRLTKLRIYDEQSQAILRHCPDLLDGCQIDLFLEEKNKNSTLFLGCLTRLEEVKPIVINVSQSVDQVFDFWHHPTFQNCSWIDFFFYRISQPAATMMNIFEWLHHRPIGMDHADYSADQQVRCMTVWLSDHDQIDWFIVRCSHAIQQGQQPIDRRSFVFSFMNSGWSGFGQFHRVENKSTGEVLVLDPVMRVNGQPTREYRLRRCLVKEEANGEEFYTKMFRRSYGFDKFNIGEKTPKVLIG